MNDVSLRWHYPCQVLRVLGGRAQSQPAVSRKLPVFVWPSAVMRACAQYTPRQALLHPAEAEAARLKRSGVIKKDQGIFARKRWCIAVTDVEGGELADVFDGMLCHPANH